MMVLDVSAAPHRTAMDVFFGANHEAADAVVALLDVLQGCGGMAGTDTGGREWGAQYDRAADAVRVAAGDLAGSLGTMANLLDANLVNHDRADHGAVLSVPGPSATLADTGDLDPTHYSVHLGTSALPSAVGGTGGVPHGWNLVQSRLDGLLWPDADTGKLRTAAQAWLTGADRIVLLAHDVSGARRGLQAIVSPEMHLVDDACAELVEHCHDVGDALRELGDACRDYADEVDRRHHDVIRLLEELVAWTAADQVVGGLLSVVSAGLAEVPTQGLELGMILRYAAKVRDVLVALKTVATGWAARMVVAAGTALRVSARLARFARAERVAVRIEKAGMLVILRGKKLGGVLRLPTVESEKLGNVLNHYYYRGEELRTATGNGTTADAIRYELATGGLVEGKTHLYAGRCAVRALRTWLRRNPDAPATDIGLARDAMADLMSALAGH